MKPDATGARGVPPRGLRGGLARLAGAVRALAAAGRRRCPRASSSRRGGMGALALALLAVLVAAPFAAPAQAQTVETLVSNLRTGTVNDTSIGGSDGFRIAQQFTVESGDDYTLTEIVLRTGAGAGITVAIRNSTEDGKPAGMDLYTLTTTGTGAGNRTFTAPANAILEKGKSYFVVVGGPSSGTRKVNIRDSTGQSGISGWTIADDGHAWENALTTWPTYSEQFGAIVILEMRLRGYSNAPLDATLSALAFTDADDNTLTLNPAFASGTLEYTISVETGIDVVTVAPTANNSDATWEILDGTLNKLADADRNADGFQVDLRPGPNFIKVKVTAENGTDTKIYKTQVYRRKAPAGTTPGFTVDTEELFSGTLGIAEPLGESGPEGYCTFDFCELTNVDDSFGSLSPSTFEIEGASGTFKVESVRYGASSGNPKLFFSLNATLFPTGFDTSKLVVQVGTNTYMWSDSKFTLGKGRFWELASDHSERPWPEPEAGATVTVKLLKIVEIPDDAAQGAPAITGTPQVGKTLAVSTSDITDTDGKTGAEDGDTGYAYTYQWTRMDGDGVSNPVQVGTGATYTLVAADLGKRFKVKVSFTDDADNAEGPLQSAIFPARGAVTAADSSAIWTATLTVADLGGGALGSSTPTPATFTHGGTVQVTRVSHAGDFLTLTFTGDLGGSSYTLLANGVSVGMGDPGDGATLSGFATNIDWSVGDGVTLKLFEGGGDIYSTDATLSSLGQSLLVVNNRFESGAQSVALTPAFDPATLVYETAAIEYRTTLKIGQNEDPATVEQFILVPKTSHPGATLEIFDQEGNSLGGFVRDPFRNGTYTYTVRVTAEDRRTTKTYTVIYVGVGIPTGSTGRRLPRLLDLTFTPVGSGSIVWMKPAFDRDRRGPYTIWTTHDVRQVTLNTLHTPGHTLVGADDSNDAVGILNWDANPNLDGMQLNVHLHTAPRTEKLRWLRVQRRANTDLSTNNPDEWFGYTYIVQRPAGTLTGTLTKWDGKEDGNSPGDFHHRFRLNLSAPVELSLADWKDNVFTVTNGTITSVKQVGGADAGPGGDPIARTWQFTVEATDEAKKVTVAYTAKADCATAGAVCTAGGLRLNSFPSLTLRPPDRFLLSVEDAQALDGDDELVFTIRLPRPRRHLVRVRFETIDEGSDMGTATPSGWGARNDYAPHPDSYYLIQPGETSVEARVRIFDGATAGETVNVRIRDAEAVDRRGNRIGPVLMGKNIATGTIARDCAGNKNTRCSIAVNSSVRVKVRNSSDKDWYRVELVNGNSYLIDLRGGHAANVHEIFGIYDNDGIVIPNTGYSGNDSATAYAFVTHTATRTGVHFISAGGTPYNFPSTYTLTVTDLGVDECTADTNTACSVTVGGTVSGALQSLDDRDWFRVELERGKVYRIEMPSPDEDSDVTLQSGKVHAVYDSDGNELDGDPATFQAKRTGVHYIEAGGHSPNADENIGLYTLAVTELDLADDCLDDTDTDCSITAGGSKDGEIQWPYERDWYEVEFKSGKLYRIDLKGNDSDSSLTNFDLFIHGIHDDNGERIADTQDDDGGTGTDSRVEYRATRTGVHYLHAGSAEVHEFNIYYLGTYRLEVTVRDHCSAATDTSCTVEAGSRVTGNFETGKDIDWYRVEFENGKTYQIDLRSNEDIPSLTFASQPVIDGIYDNDGNKIDGTSDIDGNHPNGFDARVTYTADRTGVFYIAAEGDGANTGTYRLDVSEVANQQVFEPLSVAFEGLPAGHDGSTAFTLRLKFSADVAITPEAMRDHALGVSGATVSGAEKVDGRADLWEVTLVALGRHPLPNAKLAVVVGGDSERHQGLEVELLGAVGVEQLGRRVAEAKPLIDGALGDAEARGDGRDGDAGIGEPGERDHLVGGVHRDAHDVLRERELAGVAVRGDFAGYRVIGVQRAVLSERLERREAAPAGDDGEALDAVRVRLVGPHDEVLQQVVLGDGGPELGLGRLVGRGLAHVLGREREPAERDVPDRRFVQGCDVVHSDLPWMRGGARSATLSGPARARPAPARLRLFAVCSRNGA